MDIKSPQRSPLKKSLLPRMVRKFIALESASGLFMIGFLVLATVITNSPLHDWYEGFIHTPIIVAIDHNHISAPLKEWVKDVLMVFFFLVVAIELKIEMLEGSLSQKGQVILPLLAAAGGVLVPALIYTGFNYTDTMNIHGWAIPTATDIAFALAIAVLAGKHVPPSAKILLLAIAIFDDLFAILIIALFYSSGLALNPLLLVLLGIGVLYALNRMAITQLTPYMLVGIYLWFCLHSCGIHTTIAGVLVGMAIPLRGDDMPNKSPLRHCMHLLHGWVSYLILPLFAFTAAGIDLTGMTMDLLLSPIPLGIALGLFLGKPIGIFLTTLLAVKLKVAPLPEGMSWNHVGAIAVTAGIGFTMSLFIGLLAFSNEQIQHMVKMGVVGGSLLSAITGYVLLRYFSNDSSIDTKQ